MQNHFVRDKSEYKRQLDIVDTYTRDAATYLSKMTGKPLDKCKAYVSKVTGKEGKFAKKDPDVLCLSRKKNGDREKIVLPFSQYLSDTIERKDLIAPTLTSYLHPTKCKSLLGLYIDGNLAKRKKLKKEEFAAKMAKLIQMASLRNNQQNSTKIKNNALSGAHASSGTPLYNKSSHSTLTSVCRSATSYGNANNEKFISGNRHYWCPDIVKANIISISNTIEMDLLERVIERYGIHYPSVEETMECINYSTVLYWNNAEETLLIKRLVSTLSNLERAAFVYVGDFFHLTKYNDGVSRKLIDKITHIPPTTLTVDQTAELLSSVNSDLVAYVTMLCKEDMKGIAIDKAREEKPSAYCKVGSVAKNVIAVLDEYSEFIKAFWAANTLPTSIATLPNSIRRSALVSDTDSTIFTVQEWGNWYTGKYDFSQKSCAVSDTITYFTSQCIIHVLATMCANIGVDNKDLHRLSMKNEYSFPVFVLTSRAKHYFASRDAQEGNVFDALEREIKGVGLRSSSCPAEIMKEIHAMMSDIMDTVLAGKNISIKKYYDIIAGHENSIRRSVETGSSQYLTKGRINSKQAYKVPGSSAYVHYELWRDVFGDKYGHTEEPPYSAIKVSLDINNRTELDEWLNKMEDPIIREKLREWLKARNKDKLTNLLLPESIVLSSGIPKEIIAGIDIRKLIYETVKPFYVVLESLGIYMCDDNISRLVSDTHIPSSNTPAKKFKEGMIESILITRGIPE